MREGTREGEWAHEWAEPGTEFGVNEAGCMVAFRNAGGVCVFEGGAGRAPGGGRQAKSALSLIVNKAQSD